MNLVSRFRFKKAFCNQRHEWTVCCSVFKCSVYQKLIYNYLLIINFPHTFHLLYQSMKSNSDASNPEMDKPQEIPKELWMMVDHLFRYAKKQVRTSGLPYVLSLLKLVSLPVLKHLNRAFVILCC